MANVAKAAMDAAKIAYTIKTSFPPDTWKAQIEAIPDEDIRERCRVMLRKVWLERKERAARDATRIRRETGGKKSETGDAALAALAKRFGRA